MTESTAKVHLPAWAKTVLIVFISGAILTIAVLASAAAWIAQLPQTAHDPAKVRKVVESIANFELPLPAGFVYDTGLTVFWHIRFAALRYDPDKSVVWLIRAPNPSKTSGKRLVQQAAKNGAGTSSVVIDGQGTQTVAGEEMDYVEGNTTDLDGVKARELVGAVVPKGKQDSVLIITVTPGDKLNRDAINRLLASIKGF